MGQQGIQGEAGPAGLAGPEGPPGLSDYQRIVASIDIEIEPNVAYQNGLGCPAGLSVLGGGISATYQQLLAAIQVFYSYPASESSWAVSFSNIAGETLPAGSVSLYIICAVVAS